MSHPKFEKRIWTRFIPIFVGVDDLKSGGGSGGELINRVLATWVKTLTCVLNMIIKNERTFSPMMS